MKYADLDERAKTKALEKWRETMCTDEWWDCTYEDAIICAEKIGIDIGTRAVRTTTGKSYETPDISFSGFWSQGDGCSFSGTLRVANMATAVTRLEEHVGEDESLFKIAAMCEATFATINAYWVSHRIDIDADDDSNEYPECDPTMTIKIEGKDHHGYSTKIDDNEVTEDIAKELNAIVDSFADWIYAQLEAEHNHQTSDENVLADIEANKPSFDEDGNIE